MSSVRRKRAAIIGFALFLFAPEAAILALVTVAFGWQWALFLILVEGALVALALVARRSTGAFGAAVGVRGWDPNDYAQWTRYLVIRPIVLSVPVSAAVIASTVVTSLAGTSLFMGMAIAAVCGIAAFPLGALLWARFDRSSGR